MADTTSRGTKNENAPAGAAKLISESKLKAFEEGTMIVGKKAMSKRELEEQRRKQDQVEAAAVYEEFVASFQDTGKQPKTWVKGGVVNPDKSAANKGDNSRIYKPKSKLAELASTFQSVKEANKDRDREDSPAMKKKKEDAKKKSNLEMFKEELKRIQEEREERHKLKKLVRSGADPGGGGSLMMQDRPVRFDPMDGQPDPSFQRMGGLELSSDETSTNIYIGNINPKMTEGQLLELFGRYGPLASIKIMWPRTEEEISRGRNCGFVAFMNRKDGERALNHLKGKEICGFEMKLGWGKPVPIPPHPVYIPPALAELTMPPPPSGLPFNAQPSTKGRRNKEGRFNRIPPPMGPAMDETLAKATVKVVIPTERNLLCVIHRMVEFVVREGPMFEAMIMNRELNNPMFKFLFDNQSPAHVYYRWKLYSILNGDLPYKWRTEEFRMFRGGSYWKPPVMNPYTQGMPEDLVDLVDAPMAASAAPKVEEEVILPKRGKLTDSQRDRLEDTLRELTPERPKIGEAMVWCMDHAESAEEVVDCITESLSILQTPIPKKIARLFLVSDILFNSSAKVPNASHYRKHFQRKLKEIFRDVHETYDNIDGRLKAEQFKQKVMLCFRAWEDWAIYPNDYLINLQNIFLGLVPKALKAEKLEEDRVTESLELDGAPLEDPDLDGAPLLVDPMFGQVEERPLEKMVMKVIKSEPDLDGLPLAEDLDGEPINDSVNEEMDGKPLETKPAQPKFVMSKWETIDENELEAQAMTTSKWDLLGEDDGKGPEEDVDGQPIPDEDVDGREMSEEEGLIDDSGSQDGRDSRNEKTPRSGEMTEERRQKLREIEVKVMKYQDELEAGRRSRKPNMSLMQQVEHHRKKLLAKEFSASPQTDQQESRKRHRSISPQYRYEDSPKRSKRSKSPKRSRRSRSRSPRRRSSSRSPSHHRRKSKKHKRKD